VGSVRGALMDVYRLLASGSRRYTAAHRAYVVDAFDAALDRIWREHPDVPVVLVHGAARGLDTLADAWAKSMPGVEPEPHPAQWELCGPECPRGKHRRTNSYGEYCPKAGTRRNRLMVSLGADLCLAFPGPDWPEVKGGTGNCMDLAEAVGIEVKPVLWPAAISSVRISGSASPDASAVLPHRARASGETR
jgi:hypothetical protein